MAYVEKTSTSYSGRLGKSAKGILAGLVLFIGGTIMLFWNEGNFVKLIRAVKEAQGVAIAVSDVSSVDPAYEGKLIHASARAETDATLSDSLFGVSENAIALRRKVEYYQWKEDSRTEKRDKLGGGQEETTTYTYNREWTDRPVNSRNFKDPEYLDSNFVWLDIGDERQFASEVAFGAYKLPAFFIEQIGGAVAADVNPPADQIDAWSAAIRQHPRCPKIEPVAAAAAPAATPVAAVTAPEADATAAADAEADSATPAEAPATPEPTASAAAVAANPAALVHVSGGTVYFGQTPARPDIGDLRVSFTRVLPHDVSLLARVNGQTFGRFVAQNGKTISRLEDGIVSSDEMFAHEQHENKMQTWFLRLIGVLLVCAGLRAILGLFEALAKVIPFLGTIVGTGINFVSAVFGIAWSLFWIAIAWLRYRPLVGLPLLVLAVGCIYLVKTRSRQAALATDEGDTAN